MKIALTGGGTAGHVYPLLAIKERIGEGEFIYIGSKRGIEGEIVKNIKFFKISAAPFPSSLRNIAGLLKFFLKLIPGVAKSWWILRRFRPDLVISSGGYVSVPAVLAARLLSVPVLLHEQNLVPGRANLLLSRFASAVAVSFPDTKKFFKGKAFYTGYPVRKRIKRVEKQEARRRLGFPGDVPLILVFGGSRGARSINQAVASLSRELLEKGFWVFHSSGVGYPDYDAYGETEEILREKGVLGNRRYVLRRYIEEMEYAYSAADLVVCRAGAGTIEELKMVRKPGVLVPKIGLPGEHQLHNALFLKRYGVAEVVVEREGEIPPGNLLRAIEGVYRQAPSMEASYEKLEELRQEIGFRELVEKISKGEAGFARRVFSSALGVSISRLFGFLREIFIGGYFGTSLATDIFAVSLTIASFFRRVVGENAMDNAFLPSFLKAKNRGRARELAFSVLGFFLLASAAVVLLLEITLPSWFHLVAPGFAKKGVLAQGIALTRIMLPYLLLVTIIGWAGAILKGNNKFATAEGSSAFYSIGIIIAVVFLARKLSFYSLGIGVLLGGILQVAFLIMNLENRYFGQSHKKKLVFDPLVFSVALLALPILLDVSFSKLSDIVDKILATPLQNGAVAALYFAAIVFRLPVNVIGNSINNVVLRDFSRAYHGNREESLPIIYRGFNYHFMLLLPATLFTLIFSKPIISVLFQRGAFGLRSLEMTSAALTFYSISIIAWGLSAMAGKLFAARLETHLSMWTNAAAVSLNVMLSILLVKKMGFKGLALATSISLYFAVLLRYFILHLRMKRDGLSIDWGRIGVSFLRWSVGVAFSVGSGYLFYRLFSDINLYSPFLSELFALTVSMVVAGAFLLAYYFITKGGNGQRPGQKTSKDYSREEIEVMLFSSDWRRVNQGVKLAGKYGLEEFRERLEELALEGNGFVRRNAINSLGRFSPSPSTFRVLGKASTDPYYEVRAAVARALASYPEGKEILLRLLGDRWFEVREKALISLAKLGGKEVLPEIRRFYYDSNYRLRVAAVEALLILRRRGILSPEEAREEGRKIMAISEGFSPKFPIKEKLAALMEE